MTEKRTPEMGRPPQYGETMKETTIRFRIDQLAWLKTEAQRRGISRNDLIRDLVDSEMERTGSPTENDKKTRTP